MNIFLCFTENQIGVEGAIALSECLKSNSSLQILYLGGKSIRKFIINILIFTENQIGVKGVIALSEYLKSNSSLQILYLGGKSIRKFILNIFLYLQKTK
jgi:hypothetical protein